MNILPPAAGGVLAPALALVLWTLVVWAVMIAVRPRAMIRAGVPWQAARYTAELTNLPPPARDVSDNYNHLMEQPTLFYALVFLTHLTGGDDGLSGGLAWSYVALRIVHSGIQMTFNRVTYRFWAFFASTLVLVALAARNLLALFA